MNLVKPIAFFFFFGFSGDMLLALIMFLNFIAGKESSTCLEGNSEAPSIYQRSCHETPSNDYTKMLAICCEHSVTGLW